MRRQLVRVVVATVMALPLVGAANAAAAGTVDLICPFAATIQFSPGLGLSQEAQQITGTTAYGTRASLLTPCSSVLTGVPYIGATGPVAGSGTIACVAVNATGLVGGATGTVQVTWNNGDTSTISWSATLGGPVPTIDGAITSGAMQGATVALVAIPTGLTGNCVFAPFTSLSFTGILAFLRLKEPRRIAAKCLGRRRSPRPASKFRVARSASGLRCHRAR